jgi:NAD+ synthase (glutamine-hydrolysing)
MRHGFVKVAAMSPKIKVADPEYNAGQVIAGIEEAAEHKAKIVVFPELCLTGYTCNDLFLQKRLLDEAVRQLVSIAGATDGNDALIFVGLPFEWKQKLYNTAAVIHNGRVIGLVPKTYLPDYAEFYEARHFVPGPHRPVTAVIDGEEVPMGTDLLFAAEGMEELTVGCELCEDVWVPDTPSTRHALAGATVMVNLSASDETVAKEEYRRQLVAMTSARLISAYIYASAGEGESSQDLVFGGHSIIAENGSVLAEAERFSSRNIYTEIDVQRISHERRRMTTYGSAAETDSGYQTVMWQPDTDETELTRRFYMEPFVPADPATREKRCEEILNIQACGLRKRYEHTGSESAVIGLSGGLDSTLALIVTARAFDMLGMDHKNIETVTMPCFGTTDRTYSNACKLAKALGTTLTEINISEAVNIHFRDIAKDPSVHDVTYENCQARERTQVLMDVANKDGGLVIGTGDMSELALGWATYNGDHMSMYGVNVGVPKTLVRHLVSYAADTCGQEELQTVLRDVLDTPVSPELLPPVDGKISQKTEDLVGPYELHDFFLYYMLRCGFEPGKIYRIALMAFAGKYDADTIRKWMKAFYRRFFQQQFKRSCLPDGPKVGSVALSPRGDWRMPSDASGEAWIKQVDEL